MRELDYVALYAALLSTIIFLRDLASAKGTLKVNVAHGVDTDRGKGAFAVIRVSNMGPRPLVLFHTGLLYKFREVGMLDRLRHGVRYRRVPRRIDWAHSSLPGPRSEHPYPTVVEPLHSVDIWVSFAAIDKVYGDKANVFIAVAQDALGRNSYSKPFQMRGKTIVEDVAS